MGRIVLDAAQVFVDCSLCGAPVDAVPGIFGRDVVAEIPVLIFFFLATYAVLLAAAMVVGTGCGPSETPDAGTDSADNVTTAAPNETTSLFLNPLILLYDGSSQALYLMNLILLKISLK